MNPLPQSMFIRLFATVAFLVAAANARGIPQDTTADAVLGQTTFSTNLANQGGAPSASTLQEPRGLFADSAGRLWVADNANNRVLMWSNATSFANGAAADLVLGQADFASNLANRGGANPAANTISGPRSVVVDSAGRLYVADSSNFRILRFDPPFSNGMNAVQVFGQAGSFTTANQAAINAATADNLGNPDGIGIDPQDNLFCTDRFLSRVVRYNTPATTDTTADLVIGQPNFTSAGGNQGATPAANTVDHCIACFIDAAGNLYVADEFNNRVLLFPAPLSNNMNASRVYGQPNFTTNGPNQGGISANSMNGPVGVAIDPISGNLYVADGPNMRILEFTTPQTNSTASRVFGQGGDFTTNTVNKGGVSADSIDDVAGVSLDAAGNLYAGDRLNHRVLRYDIAPPGQPTTTGTSSPAPACGLCGFCGAPLMPLMLVGWVLLTRRSRRSLEK
ncbi:MAG TPA: NHL repeat-containing protein [Phycisphaerae bacterium]|nr:NHL repeat-containing protein [Phycisphaerae bacterium]